MISTRSTRDRMGRATAFLLLVCGLAGLGAAPAKANTYIFAFTAQQALNALKASEGASLYNESGYHSLFVQPDPVQISSYTYTSVSSPNPLDANAWATNTITDPSSPNLGYDPDLPCSSNCTWAQFSKGPAQTEVALLTEAGLFLNVTHHDSEPPPYGWGSTPGQITSFLAANAVFRFVISTSQTLSGSYHLRGFASALESGSPFAYTLDTKETDGIPFDLSVAVTATPEPGTAGLVFAALAASALTFRRRSGRARR